MHFVRNLAQGLNAIQQHCTGRPQQIRGLAGYDAAISQLQSNHCAFSLLCHLLGHSNNPTVINADLSLLHEQLQRINLLLSSLILHHTVPGLIITTDNLLTRSLATNLVITNAIARHIYAHIRGRLIGTIAINAFKNRCQYRINLHIPVVVDGGNTISL